jgi:hypothetical protein
MTLVMGHHAETQHTARNFLFFHFIAVRPSTNCTLLFVTGGDDIARFDSRRYRNSSSVFSLPLCSITLLPSVL